MPIPSPWFSNATELLTHPTYLDKGGYVISTAMIDDEVYTIVGITRFTDPVCSTSVNMQDGTGRVHTQYGKFLFGPYETKEQAERAKAQRKVIYGKGQGK